MAEAKIKPRWKTWENLCIEKSVKEKIQLKIIALALGKTLNAVSKKITHMGLRKISSKPGARKGMRASPALKASTFTEIERMRTIVSQYAPQEKLQKAQLDLEKGHWVQKKPKHEAAYSLQSTPAYIVIKGRIPDKVKKVKDTGDSCYVRAEYFQTWAASEGFRPVGGNLMKQGICFWKEGHYFSKAQFMMHVNRIRFENSLPAVVVYEDELT